MIRLFSILLFSGLLAVWVRPAEPEYKDSGSSHFYPELLPGTFTGGFGEDSCHSCHFDYPLNPQDGSLHVEGIPESYRAGKSYTISIHLKRDGLGQAGFQMSSRFEDGSQAGSFSANSDLLQFTETDKSTQYIQHSAKGSKTTARTSSGWEVRWTAPETAAGPVIFNIAANAGNGDASAFGDFIYTLQEKSSPAD